MRVATVDIGTNSVNLLVADVASTGAVTPRHEDSQVARLGQGVDAARGLHPEAIGRVAAVVERYAAVAGAHGVTRLHCTATSAARDAANREDLADALHAVADLELAVLSGEDEARWSFAGACSALPPGALAAGVVVLDIGGGSTELIGGRGHDLGRRISLDVGSVRYTERFASHAPPPPEALGALQQAIDAALAPLQWTLEPGDTLVGVAGTVTSVAALELGMQDYEWGRVEGLALSLEQVAARRAHLATLTAPQILALAPGVLHGREDLLLTGTCILEAVMRAVGAPRVRVSERGLRHGWAIRVATRGDG